MYDVVVFVVSVSTVTLSPFVSQWSLPVVSTVYVQVADPSVYTTV
jgi:hypothetical protein